uniref:Uncharacterized protein n=1 Tax=Triticum urartu TaxID=4572 RepID=A0A8R7U2Q6_TRIUA
SRVRHAKSTTIIPGIWGLQAVSDVQPVSLQEVLKSCNSSTFFTTICW